MLSTSPKSLFLLLLSVCGASAARKNANMTGRTFLYFGHPEPDELFPPDAIYGDDHDKNSNEQQLGNSTRLLNRTILFRPEISEEALLFFTGPLSTVLIPSFYTVVCLISLPVNVLAVVAFARRIRPKKPAAIYMLNLACADLIFALLLPFKISYHFNGNNWTLGPFMCRLVTGAFYWNMYCSVLLITCISVDRLLAVVYPIDSLVWRRPQKAVAACVTMWVLSFAGSVPLVLSDQTIPLVELGITTCHDLQHLDLIWHYKAFFITLCCALFFLPLLVTVVSYARVIWSLSRVPQGVPGRSRRRTRAVVMALTVLVMFVLCFLPTNCLLLAHYVQLKNGIQENGESSYAAYLVFMCLGSLNCLLDPLVYYFGSSQCQRQLGSMLSCKKITEGGSSSRSSDSRRSSTRTILKSGRTEISKINSSSAKVDSFQGSLNSQYKKLLV